MTTRGTNPTIRDVARQIGVAPSTVSRALNGHPDVSLEMNERVREAAKAIGYEPDYLARSLRRGTSKTIGFLLRDIANPLFGDLVIGASEYLEAAGYSLLLMNSAESAVNDLEHILQFQARRVDGIIASLQSEVQPGLGQLLSRINTPIVLIDREIPGLSIPSVVVDNRSGMHAAVQHLIDLGHRRIAFISGSPDVLTTRERLAGLSSTMNENGLAVDSELIRLGSYDRDFGYEQAFHVLSPPRRASAIIVGGIRLLVGTLAACQELSIEIGQEVSIVTWDHTDMMDYLHPPISSILRHPRDLGRQAAEILIGQVRDGVISGPILSPTEYFPRGSTSPPPQA